MTFSSPAGFLKQGLDVDGLLASLQALFNIAQVAGTYTLIMKILHLPWINPVLAPQPTDKSGPGILQGVRRGSQLREALSDVIRDSLQGKPSKNDIRPVSRPQSRMSYSRYSTMWIERVKVHPPRFWSKKP
jgi:hypothetical protein